MWLQVEAVLRWHNRLARRTYNAEVESSSLSRSTILNSKESSHFEQLLKYISILLEKSSSPSHLIINMNL